MTKHGMRFSCIRRITPCDWKHSVMLTVSTWRMSLFRLIFAHSDQAFVEGRQALNHLLYPIRFPLFLVSSTRTMDQVLVGLLYILLSHQLFGYA
jgi:hypothetical protein